MLLDLLHGRLGIQGRHNRPVFIHARHMRNGLAWVTGCAGEAEGLGAVERDGVPHFACTVRVCALERRLLRGLGLRRIFLGCRQYTYQRYFRLQKWGWTYSWPQPCLSSFSWWPLYPSLRAHKVSLDALGSVRIDATAESPEGC